MKNIIKHGIIGCGRIAQNHVIACRENNIKIVFCCDLDINKAKEFALKYNIESYSDNYFEMLTSDVDSVSICTDHKSHTEIAFNSIKQSKHTLIEKPLSNNLSNVLNFYELIKNENVVISTISQHRFDDVVIFVRDLLLNNELGEVSIFNAHLKCQKDPDYYTKSYWRGNNTLEGGSTVINQSFHILDILVYYFGLPQKVSAMKKTIKFNNEINTEDSCVAVFEYNNFLGTFSSTNTSVTEWATSVEIIGTKGEITFSLDFPEKIIYLSLEHHLLEKYKFIINKINDNYEKNKNSGVNYFGLSHIKQFSNFKNSILGKEINNISLKSIIETQMLIDKIYNI